MTRYAKNAALFAVLIAAVAVTCCCVMAGDDTGESDAFPNTSGAVGVPWKQCIPGDYVVSLSGAPSWLSASAGTYFGSIGWENYWPPGGNGTVITLSGTPNTTGVWNVTVRKGLDGATVNDNIRIDITSTSTVYLDNETIYRTERVTKTLPYPGGGYFMPQSSNLSHVSGTSVEYEYSSNGTYSHSVAYHVDSSNTAVVYKWSTTVTNRPAYTIDFVTNGGSSVSTIYNLSHGSTYSLPTSYRSGYTGYWYIPGGMIDIYGFGTTATATRNLTYYANWVSTEPRVVLQFNTYGGNSVADMPTAAHRGQDNVNVILPTPERPSYTFRGWYTAETGGAKLSNNLGVINVTPYTLHAQWDAVGPVAVSFDLNGGSGAISDNSALPGNAITLPTPTEGVYKQDHTLTGWTLGSPSGTQYATGAAYVVTTTPVTFYAVWTEVVGVVDSAAPATGKVNTLYTYNPARTGIWNTMAGLNNNWSYITDDKPSWLTATYPTMVGTGVMPKFSGTPTAAGTWQVKIHMGAGPTVVPNSTVTWTIVVTDPAAGPFDLSYDANGGVGSIAQMKDIPAGNVRQLPSDGIVKEGYTLGGWWVNVQGTDVTYPLGSMLTVTKNITARACWVAQSNIVVLDANGGTMADGQGFAAHLSVTNGVIALPTSGLSRGSDTFAGWYVSNGSSKIYARGYMYTTMSTTTFKAYWIASGASTVNVTYDANGGVGGYSQTVEPNKKVVLPMYGVTKSGSALTGWTEGSTSGTSHNNGAVVQVSSSTSFFAKWQEGAASQIVVVYDLMGGNGAISPQTLSGSGTLTKPSNPTKSAHIFTGWKVRGGASDFDFATVVDSSMTLEAQWQQHYIVAADGLTVTVTLKAYTSTTSTVTWWDGKTTTSTAGSHSHTFAAAGAGNIVVSSKVSDEETVTSSTHLSVSSGLGSPTSPVTPSPGPVAPTPAPTPSPAPTILPILQGIDTKLVISVVAVVIVSIILYFVAPVAIVPFLIVAAILIYKVVL